MADDRLARRRQRDTRLTLSVIAGTALGLLGVFINVLPMAVIGIIIQLGGFLVFRGIPHFRGD